MVFIPGLTFSGEIFKNQLEYFSSEYRVIAIDPRGQGFSAKTVDGNDYLTHGRDVAGQAGNEDQRFTFAFFQDM